MEAGEPTNLPSFTSLPNEIICNILKDLPVKILLRCRCVCKDWNSIITGQSFINNHLLSQPQGYLFCHFFISLFSPPQLCSFFPDASFSLVHEFEVPLPYSAQELESPVWILVGSLDGLLCLTDSKSFGREIHLWNPTIRKCITLSNSCLFNENDHQSFFSPKTTIAFGLGFSVQTSDRVIIRILVFQSISSKLKSNCLPQAEVYSLSTESWKKVKVSEDVSKRLIDIRSRRYVNLHGELNWMATFSDEEGRLYESILSFDVDKEEFKEIKLPREYGNGIGTICHRIEVYGGSLAMVISGNLIPDDGSTYVWLWVMQEYGKLDSWRRTTVKQFGPKSLSECFILDGRIMFKMLGCTGTRRVKLFDMETLEEREFWLPNFVSVHTFKETLVSLPSV